MLPTKYNVLVLFKDYLPAVLYDTFGWGKASERATSVLTVKLSLRVPKQ